MSILISETYVDRSQHCIVGETEPYEPFTDNLGKLFRSLSREYGRCISKVYVDPDSKPIGWVFEKRRKYEDCDKYYIAETWVTVHDAPDTVTRTPHYHKLSN